MELVTKRLLKRDVSRYDLQLK
uniref:Uncharacterized protein n=1 Tax=Musa acuminata subsp. malaccensis TaxID=214687 RepID=A0A804KU70_MUSAM